MDTLVAQYSHLVTKEEIGRTYENRPMYVLKVGVNPRVRGVGRDGWWWGGNCVFSAHSVSLQFSTGGYKRPAISWTLGSTPGSGCPRPPGCGPPTRYCDLHFCCDVMVFNTLSDPRTNSVENYEFMLVPFWFLLNIITTITEEISFASKSKSRFAT